MDFFEYSITRFMFHCCFMQIGLLKDREGITLRRARKGQRVPRMLA